jgi:hypothetical protein
MKQKLPIGILLWCALVIVASFMTWATVQAHPTLSIGSFPLGNMGMNFSMTMTVTAWNGSLTLLQVQTPNWLIVPAAVVVALVAALRAFGFKQASPVIEWVLSIFGVLYMIAFVLMIVDGGGTLGIGSILTLIAFIGMVVSIVLQSRAKRSPASPLAGDSPAV